MKIRGGAALAVVLGLVIAPIAVGSAAYAEEGDETVVVAPAEETAADAPETAPESAVDESVPVEEIVVPADEAAPADEAPPVDEVLPPVDEAVPPAEDTSDVQPLAVTEEEKQVWVCKYSGTPGVDEEFKNGKNPILVGEATLGADFTGTFPYTFADAQGRSVAIAYGDQDMTKADCPDPEGPPQESVAPSGWVYDNCGTANDSVEVNEVAGIEYVLDESVPNQVTITAYALDGYNIVLPPNTEWSYDAEADAATIVIVFTDEPCPIAVTPGATPIDECGTANDDIHVAENAGLSYELDSTAGNGTVVVSAWAIEGYTVVVEEGSEWYYDSVYDGAHLLVAFTDDPCPVVVPPAPAGTSTAVLAATGGASLGAMIPVSGGVATILGMALLIGAMIRRRVQA